MKIIFICKYNAFRSRSAEKYFNKINKNKKIKVISRGFIRGSGPDKEQIVGAKKILGVDIQEGKSKVIGLQEMIDANKIIVVAKDVPKIMFDYQLTPISKKVVYWNIPDEQKRDKAKIDKIVNTIKTKVEKLVKKNEE